MILRPAEPADFSAVLALNEESVQFLSPMSRERLERLHAEAELHAVIESEGAVCAFLLAYREGTDYDSVNYRWFQQRFQRFLYVDRVVVSRCMQGRGAGAALYRHVFAHAAETSVPVVTCEYDVDPPNEVSERFHARFGFREVGRQRVADGRKAVSLQASVLTATAGTQER